MQVAYVPCRAALFRTNSKAQAESEQTMSQARQGWSEFVARYAAKPLAPYDRDPAVAATLAEVDAVCERASAQIQAQQLVPAHEALERARDLMAGLRQRNGVIVFSDHVNAYHAEMEHVLELGPKLLDEAQGGLELLARVGALDYLARCLRSEAPPALARDAEFVSLQQQVEASVSALRAALMRQDAAAAHAALGKVKGPYSRPFLKFG